MSILDAEISFKKGLVALVKGNAAQALACFESAVRTESERRVKRPQMRYLSYYGLALALSRKPTPESIRACEMAARTDSFNPDLEMNLGKVYLLAGQRSKARGAFKRGLVLAPRHVGLQCEMAQMERDDRAARRCGVGFDHALGALRSAVSSVAHRFAPARRDASIL